MSLNKVGEIDTKKGVCTDTVEGETEFYKITSVTKDDIRSCFKDTGGLTKKVEKRIDSMTDSEMKHLASKMADDYLNQLYWSSLEIIFKEIFMGK